MARKATASLDPSSLAGVTGALLPCREALGAPEALLPLLPPPPLALEAPGPGVGLEVAAPCARR